MFKFSRYHEQDVLALIRILRLAIILNRARQATEKPQKITLKTDRTLVDWHLTFETDYLQHNPLVKNDLALEHRFLQTLGLSLSAR
ncbi:exopolyphosphatase [Aggregatibacter segnis ATCC 33393]|nr:exopolyphosphatase [Aggregatibacter segnis ATCC 33393]